MTHTGDELAWRAEVLAADHERSQRLSWTEVPGPTLTAPRRSTLAAFWHWAMTRNERGEIGLAELLRCVGCQRPVPAGRALTHAKRFHGGAAIVVVPDNVAWRNAERRLADRRTRAADGLAVILDARRAARRV